MEVKKAFVLFVSGICIMHVAGIDPGPWTNTVLENDSPVGLGIRLDRYNVLTVASCINRTAVREQKVYIRRANSGVLDFVSFATVPKMYNDKRNSFDVAILHLDHNTGLTEEETLPLEDLSYKSFDQMVIKRKSQHICTLIERSTDGPEIHDTEAKIFTKHYQCFKTKRRMCLKTRNINDCESLPGGIYGCSDNGVWRPVGILQRSTKKDFNDNKCIKHLVRLSKLSVWIYENMKASISNEAPEP